jgi:nitrate reductase gamma subunit
MAAFAVFVEGDVQFPGVALSLRRIVTGETLLDRLSFLPDVLAVFIFMVTVFAGLDITLGMFQVGKPNKPLTIGFINFVFDEDLIGYLLRFSSFYRSGRRK